MKKINVLLSVVLVLLFAVLAMGSGETEGADQGKGKAAAQETVEGAIGDYSVVIDSCRLAKDYEGKDVVIVKYIFTNVADKDATSFMVAMEDNVYQNDVGLNNAFILDDSANYSEDNQTKDIKKGASIEVEVAYELNDITSDVVVEVSELFSLEDTIITKTFSIAQ